jgi:hypothetical protein
MKFTRGEIYVDINSWLLTSDLACLAGPLMDEPATQATSDPQTVILYHKRRHVVLSCNIDITEYRGIVLVILFL